MFKKGHDITQEIDPSPENLRDHDVCLLWLMFNLHISAQRSLLSKGRDSFVSERHRETNLVTQGRGT